MYFVAVWGAGGAAGSAQTRRGFGIDCLAIFDLLLGVGMEGATELYDRF